MCRAAHPESTSSTAALARFLENLNPLVSPEAAAGLVSSEIAFRRIDEEFGLLSSQTVRRLLELSGSTESLETLRRGDGIHAVQRPSSGTSYPAFQFDPVTLKIRDVIPALVALVRGYERTQEDLAQWLCTPTGYLDGARPVDLLDSSSLVLSAAEGHFGVEW